jgi:NAD(P)-dependent dehydrogenase (short-subunit alcohol dehydrogenase family)
MISNSISIRTGAESLAFLFCPIPNHFHPPAPDPARDPAPIFGPAVLDGRHAARADRPASGRPAPPRDKRMGIGYISRVTISGEESRMDLALRDRAVLVTGGSSNIGAATAVAFGREGAKVALTYRSRKDAAEKVADDVRAAGGQAYITQFDLEDADAGKRLVDEVSTHWGALDVLVNNAVRWADVNPNQRVSAFEKDDSDWKIQIDANVTNTLRVLQAAMPALRASGAGRIVNVSTSLVERGMIGAVPYTAAKSALLGATRTIAWEAGRDGVVANVVMPGWVIDGKDLPYEIPAAIMDEQTGRLPTGALPSCQHLADAIVFLCSPINKSITGEIIRVTGGTS